MATSACDGVIPRHRRDRGWPTRRPSTRARSRSGGRGRRRGGAPPRSDGRAAAGSAGGEMWSCSADTTRTGPGNGARAVRTPVAICRAARAASGMNRGNHRSRSASGRSFIIIASASSRVGTEGASPHHRRHVPRRGAQHGSGERHDPSRRHRAHQHEAHARDPGSAGPWPPSAPPARPSSSRSRSTARDARGRSPRSAAKSSIPTRPRSATGRLPSRPRRFGAHASQPRSAAGSSQSSRIQAPAQRPWTRTRRQRALLSTWLDVEGGQIADAFLDRRAPRPGIGGRGRF